MTVLGLVCLAIFLYLCFVYLRRRTNAKLPDGPPGVPIFGNALQFNKMTTSLDISNIGKRYGDAFSLNFFGEKVVVLNSYGMIKECFTSPKYAVAFGGRPDDFASRHLAPKGLLFSTYSDKWTVLRKHSLKGLKAYNMAEVEDLVQGEIKHLVERIENEAGKPVDPFIYISGYVTSIISMLITGRLLKQNDKELELLAKITDQFLQILNPSLMQMLTLFPWIRFIPFGSGKLYQQYQQNVSTMMKNITKDRLKTRGESERKPSFLDFMYEEKEKGNMTDENIISVALDLLGGGTATTRTTMYSMFLILTARPDIQKRIQEEIDEVVGRGRLPCSGDKNSMPYTQAVIWETLRHYPSDPITVTRSTMGDVHIRDYLLPKDTQIFYNIFLVLHDEKFWKDPYVFNPSRYLDDKGNLIPPEDERRQRTITFGLGKRACVGENLARLRMFMALTAVLQNFNLVPDPSHPLPDTDPRTFIAESVLLAPKYKVVFQPRN